MRLPILTLVLAACLAAPVFAEGAKSKPAPGTSVEMPFLIAPMSKDGKLLGYAYISSKLVCASQNAAITVREKLAFIQDANVRDVYAVSVSRSDDPMKVDNDALSQRLADNARRIVGAGKVVRVEFGQVQFAPLHPSESTLNMMTSQEKAAALAKTAADGNATTTTAPGQVPAPAAAATSKPASGPTH